MMQKGTYEVAPCHRVPPQAWDNRPVSLPVSIPPPPFCTAATTFSPSALAEPGVVGEVLITFVKHFECGEKRCLVSYDDSSNNDYEGY